MREVINYHDQEDKSTNNGFTKDNSKTKSASKSTLRAPQKLIPDPKLSARRAESI